MSQHRAQPSAAQSIAQSGGGATAAAAGDSLLSLIYGIISIAQISMPHDLAASIGSATVRVDGMWSTNVWSALYIMVTAGK